MSTWGSCRSYPPHVSFFKPNIPSPHLFPPLLHCVFGSPTVDCLRQARGTSKAGSMDLLSEVIVWFGRSGLQKLRLFFILNSVHTRVTNPGDLLEKDEVGEARASGRSGSPSRSLVEEKWFLIFTHGTPTVVQCDNPNIYGPEVKCIHDCTRNGHHAVGGWYNASLTVGGNTLCYDWNIKLGRSLAGKLRTLYTEDPGSSFGISGPGSACMSFFRS